MFCLCISAATLTSLAFLVTYTVLQSIRRSDCKMYSLKGLLSRFHYLVFNVHRRKQYSYLLVMAVSVFKRAIKNHAMLDIAAWSGKKSQTNTTSWLYSPPLGYPLARRSILLFGVTDKEYYTLALGLLSIRFAQFFKSLFSLLFRSLCCWLFGPATRDSIYYLALLCQGVLKSFLSFFSAPLASAWFAAGSLARQRVS